MSLHAGQVKKLLRGQIIIAKVTLERAPGMMYILNPLCIIYLKIFYIVDNASEIKLRECSYEDDVVIMGVSMA